MIHNLSGAAGIQLALLASGTLTARLLGPEKRGYLAILVAIPSAIGQLGAVGMSLAATYYLSSGVIGGSQLVRLLRRPAMKQIALLALVHAEIVLLYAFASHAPVVAAACVSLATLPAGLCQDYGIAFLLGARRHAAVNVIRILNPALVAAGMLPLYLLRDASLVDVEAVIVFASIVPATVALTRGVSAAARIAAPRDSLVERLGWAKAKRAVLAFGRQGYLGYLAPVDSFRVDQLAVGILLSPRELGLYVVGAAFTNVARLVAWNLGMSATPEIAAQTDPVAQRQVIRSTLLLTGVILAVLTIGLSLVVIIAIPVFFGAAYRSSLAVAEILLVAGFLLSMKRISVDVMRGIGETRIGSRAEIVNSGLFTVAVVPLGLWLRGPGVALALVVGAAGGSVLLARALMRAAGESGSTPARAAEARGRGSL